VVGSDIPTGAVRAVGDCCLKKRCQAGNSTLFGVVGRATVSIVIYKTGAGGASAARVNPNGLAVTTLPTLWWQFVVAALLLGITVLGIMFVFFLFDALRRMTDLTPETSPRHVLFAVLLTLGALLGGVLIGLLLPVNWLERLL
jgi:hypothetical protein